jgi:glycosyltransferase involved in cell wall biosynthesis
MEAESRSARHLRIAMCVPEWMPLMQTLKGETADATYIIQQHVARGLQARGHSLTFVAPGDLREVVCTADPLQPRLARRTWSASRAFEIVSKGVWQLQKLLGVPYLNVFSNYRLLDACLHCLPGHDVVYERNGLYRDGVARACKWLGLPYILYFEADDLLEHEYLGKPLSGLLRWRAAAAIRRNLGAADAIVCVSEQGKLHLARNWGVPEGKIRVFPNAVDVERFRPDPAARLKAREELGLRNDPLIMFVGNFYKWHDVATLLQAFAQLLLTCPQARLVLVGDGAQRPAMAQLSSEMGLNGAVRFTGMVAHAKIPGFLNAADIAVVPVPPMQHEMWLSPIKLFEYLASGLAVVASAVGQVASIVKDGDTGLLVPAGDVPAMAAALTRLISDSALRAKLGQAAREDAQRKYSWERYVSRLEALYAEVSARQQTPLNGRRAPR